MSFCREKVPTKNSLFLGGKIRYTLCRKKAERFSYFNGRDTLDLCAEHAHAYREQGLSVKEKKEVSHAPSSDSQLSE